MLMGKEHHQVTRKSSSGKPQESEQQKGHNSEQLAKRPQCGQTDTCESNTHYILWMRAEKL